ncbi:hypothetical protein SCP_0411250 [Sparassis crispa]|uniref:Uncharacterized protein n=1 Tax=Sparassis crispa TaxID=139825 RepID=A0A401GKR1_9APHY|nr:hypothetical protein SCP_0411250 [Sparassis crispa]GBE82740.1 hypothetical protein SCP_0411250 [Sparassis crispa]
MTGKKRAAEEESAGPTTRSAKAPKTEKAETATPARGRRGSKKGPKATMAASQFKARALPLHVNLTHTPPVLDPTAEGKEGAVSVSHMDAGFIGTTTLVPSTFATGSYGWKGNKRITIELPSAEGEEGEKEKVHVMLTINATVMGSKGAKEEGGEGGEEHAEEHTEEHPAENAEEKKEGEAKEDEAEETGVADAEAKE